MSLTPEQHAKRDGKITASFVPWLMAGDQDKIVREWQRLVGDPGYAPEDFGSNWAVQFGSFIEGFALDWHESKTGHKIGLRGEPVTHKKHPDVHCTLDGYREADDTVIDCKAVGAYRTIEDVRAFYLPQTLIQARCLGATKAALLIVHGGGEPKEYEALWDADYELLVWDRIAQFRACVESLTPPFPMVEIKGVPLESMRTVDMTGSNEWASEAATWTANRSQAKAFEAAAKNLKAMMEPDVARAFGYGVQITRSKAGSLTIKPTKE